MVAKRSGGAIQVAVGCAADPRGSGIAYARIAGRAGQHLLRVPFLAERSAPAERGAGYAALTAVARALRERGVGRVRFLLDDPSLLADLAGRGSLPDALVLSYVRLRCALNQFSDVGFAAIASGDLTQRARAEVALRAA